MDSQIAIRKEVKNDNENKENTSEHCSCCGCSSRALSGVLPGAHRCFGCVFLVPHRSAKSGCFGEYLNVFVVFLFENIVISRVLWKILAMDF